jgi:hypothetical protein
MANPKIKGPVAEKTPTFSRSDLTTWLGNTLTVVSRPPGWPPDGIPAIRMTNLKRFAEANLDVIKKLEGQGVIRWEEAVYSLIALALLVQVQFVNSSEILPVGLVSQKTLDKIRALVEVKDV